MDCDGFSGFRLGGKIAVIYGFGTFHKPKTIQKHAPYHRKMLSYCGPKCSTPFPNGLGVAVCTVFESYWEKGETVDFGWFGGTVWGGFEGRLC